MKKTFLAFCLTPFIISSNLNATEFQDGFNGNFSLGFGASKIQSNISTLAESSYLANYNEKNSNTAAIPFIGFELYYGNLFHNDKVFFKNYNGKNISGIALGYEKTYMQNFSTSFALLSSLREKAYANPYFKGDREEIDANKHGFKLTQNYENDWGKFSGTYLFLKNKFDKETIPYESLKREGYYHEFEFNYSYSIASFGIGYDYNDAQGKAQSYSRYGLDAGLNLIFAQDYTLTPKLSLYKYEAVGNDPIFKQKQNGNIAKLNIKLVKNNFFGNDKLYAFANYGFEKRNSDIDFYDEKYQIFITGMGYKF